MGCENIQSFTIPGAVFAQIWGEQQGGKGEHGMGGGGMRDGNIFGAVFPLKNKPNQVVLI